MGVVEAEGLCGEATVGGFLGKARDGSMWEEGTDGCLSGRAEDAGEAMQVDICKPELPLSLACKVTLVTCRDASASTSVKKS